MCFLYAMQILFPICRLTVCYPSSIQCKILVANYQCWKVYMINMVSSMECRLKHDSDRLRVGKKPTRRFTERH